MKRQYQRKAKYCISDKERAYLNETYSVMKQGAAKHFRIGLETLNALISPEGMVTDKTIMRFRERLKELNFQAD